MKKSVHSSSEKAILVLDQKFPCEAAPHMSNTIFHWNERFSKNVMKYTIDFICLFMFEVCVRVKRTT